MTAKVLPANGNDAFLRQLGQDATGFQRACDFVRTNQAKYTVGTAGDESAKLESAFRGVSERIANLQRALCPNGDIKAGEEDKFFLLTQMDDDVRQSFARALESLRGVDPKIGARATEVLSGQKQEVAKQVYVYYAGKGDLFIRGENGQVRLPTRESKSISKPVEFGQCEDLSWDRGIPMVKVADNLWQAQVVIKEGVIPKYKFLVSDCLWQSGTDYVSSPAKSEIHLPSFDAKSTSLVVPMDVGFGNKLAIFGKGTIQVDGKEVELDWKSGLDLQSFGPSLWVLPLSADGEAEFKLCLVKQGGELVWEDGANRKLSKGAEVVLTPKFPGTHCLSVPMATAGEALGAHLFGRQEDLLRQQQIEEQQRKAQLSTRALPCLKRDGKTFKDDEIIAINECIRIDEVEIEREKFQFYYTFTGKAVIIQEAPEGCTAGVSGMLILDNGKLPKGADIKNRKAASHKDIAKDIQNAGLEPVSTPVKDFHRDMAALRRQILLHGPAYVRINEGAGRVGHAIIVNTISEDLTQVEIRDPWHAWEAVVKGDAFRKAWHGSLNQCEASDSIVQVRNGKK